MPHGISKKALEKFLTAVPWDKVVKKAENAEQGTRLWPTNKSKDADANFRIDKGLNLSDGTSEMILQVNRDAKDPSVKREGLRRRTAIRLLPWVLPMSRMMHQDIQPRRKLKRTSNTESSHKYILWACDC